MSGIKFREFYPSKMTYIKYGVITTKKIFFIIYNDVRLVLQILIFSFCLDSLLLLNLDEFVHSHI